MAAGPKRQSGWKTARHSDSPFSRLYSQFALVWAKEGLEAVRKVAKKVLRPLCKASQPVQTAIAHRLLKTRE